MPDPSKTTNSNLRSKLYLYVFLFLGLMIIFYLLFTSSFFQEHIFTPINGINALLGSFFLNIIGQNTIATGESILSSLFSVDISIGCDGVEPTMIYLIAVLLTPLAWTNRLKGIVIGIAVLFLTNLLRIITLFLVGSYTPNLFDIMHIEVWQALFIVFTIACYLTWLNWSLKQKQTTDNATN